MQVAKETTFFYQPSGPLEAYLPQVQYSTTYTPPEKQIKEQLRLYFLRALVTIQAILRLLKSSVPFFDQYGPMLKQLPNMYKMIKLIQDVNEDSSDKEQINTEVVQSEQTEKRNVPSPTLFI
ncbi:MAG TPA: VrrA/YqfQ family protein [Pseudogracilibacillus sp.]|nr:VrrA/YqfQ family protein [Pseudogracilibacillus sp.]